MPLEGLCTHQFPLEKWEEAFKLVGDSQSPSVKVSALPSALLILFQLTDCLHRTRSQSSPAWRHSLAGLCGASFNLSKGFQLKHQRYMASLALESFLVNHPSNSQWTFKQHIRSSSLTRISVYRF